MLTALTGVWHAGASRRRGGEHPFRKSLAELRIGDQVVSPSREVTLDDIETFAAFTGDNFYAHMDEEAAAANPFFPGRVAHGYLLVSWAAGLFVDPGAGAGARQLGPREPAVRHAGVAGRHASASSSPRSRSRRARPTSTARCAGMRCSRNQRDEVVATYDVLTLVAKERRPAAAPDASAPGRRAVAPTRNRSRVERRGGGRQRDRRRRSSRRRVGGVSGPSGRYHSTIELIMPKSSRATIRGSMSARSSPSSRASTTSAATARSNSRGGRAPPARRRCCRAPAAAASRTAAARPAPATAPRSTCCERVGGAARRRPGSASTPSSPPSASSSASSSSSSFDGKWW